MLGHGSLQTIFTKYYAWIPRAMRNDGPAIMKALKSVKVENNFEISGFDEVDFKGIVK